VTAIAEEQSQLPMGSQWIEQDELGESTAVIVPAFFSSKPSDEVVRRLLWMTLCDTPRYLPWENVLVVVDGDARTQRIASELQAEAEKTGGGRFNLLSLTRNEGKLAAITKGMQHLLPRQPGVRVIAVRDGDGDHLISDLPQIVRAAMLLERVYGHSRTIVIGARQSRHRPMGWVRGELEELLDGLTLDASLYALARLGRAANLRHCHNVIPDLSSGYKAYGRQAADLLFLGADPHYLTMSAEDYWHFGPETVTVVEGLLADCVLAEVPRLTWDGQPTSSFNDFEHLALYGELLAWVFSRLDIPLGVAAQLIDNRTPRLLLRTSKSGAEITQQLRAYTLERANERRGSGSMPSVRPLLPFI